MNWIVLIVVFAVLGILVWKMPNIKVWYQDRKYKNMCTWVMEHKTELPIDPTVINAGEWIKIEEGSNPIVQIEGIYIYSFVKEIIIYFMKHMPFIKKWICSFLFIEKMFIQMDGL